MNKYNIHLEIQNPKKQAIDTKLEAMACYLTNLDDPAMNQQRNGSWGTAGSAMARVRVPAMCGHERDNTTVVAVNGGVGAS